METPRSGAREPGAIRTGGILRITCRLPEQSHGNIHYGALVAVTLPVAAH